MNFIKTLLGSLVVGLVLAGIIIVVDAEARKDALGIIAASMILAPTAVTFIWFSKNIQSPALNSYCYADCWEFLYSLRYCVIILVWKK